MKKIAFHLSISVFSLIISIGCTKPNPWKISEPNEIPETNTPPKITKILDLSSYEIPCCGTITSNIKGDGKGVIGETLLIRGKNFGRGPTVSIGAVPTSILARTQDGGIFVRIPTGIKEGLNNIVVTNEYGTDNSKLFILRFASVYVPNSKIHLLDMGSKKTVLDIKGDLGTKIVFHPTRPYLYITTGGIQPRLITVDLATPNKPSIINTQNLPAGKVLLFAIPDNGKFLIYAVGRGYKIFELTHPNYPIAHKFIDWPKGIDPTQIADMALSPEGKTLLVLKKDNNLTGLDLQVFDLPANPKNLGNILLDSKAPLAKTLNFLKQSTTTLWIGIGDTPTSLKVGYHPAKILVYSYTPPKDRLSSPTLKKLGEFKFSSDRFTPQLLIPATKGIDDAEDAHMSPNTILLYAISSHSEMMTLGSNPLTTPSGLQQGIQMLEQLSNTKYKLIRFDDVGNEKSFWSTDKVIGSIAISKDGKRSITVQCFPNISKDKTNLSLQCGYTFGTLKKQDIFHKEGSLNKENFLPPFKFGATAIQP